MDCETWWEQIDLLVDGELAETDQAPLHLHLEFCADCRLRLATALRGRRALARDREAALREADDLPGVEAIVSAGRRRALVPARLSLLRLPAWRIPVPVGAALAAILLVAGALVGAQLDRIGRSPREIIEPLRGGPAVVVVCSLPEVEVVGSSAHP